MVVSEPPQVEVGLLPVTVRPRGSVSVKAMPLKASFPGTVTLVLSIVNFRKEVALLAMVVTSRVSPGSRKDLEKAGGGGYLQP